MAEKPGTRQRVGDECLSCSIGVRNDASRQKQ